MQYSDLVISADMTIPDTHTLIVFSPHRVTEFSLQGVDVMLVGVNFFLQRFDLTDRLILGLHKCSHQILHTQRNVWLLPKTGGYPYKLFKIQFTYF